jgi:inositol hexakisphosphate/diphosphoinositol-pentakisphosphate kinase
MGIAHKLIDKIHEDLCWWKKNQYGQEYKNAEEKYYISEKDLIKDENQNWDKTGLDKKGLDQNTEIKSHWRHIRSRFYFTSASHMYTLLNVLKHGFKQHANIKKNNTVKDIDEWHRLDFLSGIYFRVFENLVCEEHDPSRFKLEIKLNRGSTIYPDELHNI